MISHAVAPPAPTQGATATERLAFLDGWRGLAIALVLEGHFIKVLPLEAGRLGVDIFFVLSGYLMSGLLFIKLQPLKVFYKRRLSRILPAFAVFVVGAYLIAYVRDIQFTFSEVIATLFFLRTYLPPDPGIWGTAIPIGHIWSLNVEEHAYLLLSFFVLHPALRARAGLVLIAVGFLCVLVGFIYVKLGTAAPRWGEIGTEVAAAHLLLAAGYRTLRATRRWSLPHWLPIAALMIAALTYHHQAPWWCSKLLSPLLLAVAVNHLPESAEWIKRGLAWRPLALLGTWSFSIYLWQQPVWQSAGVIPGGAAVALVLALVISLLSFYLVEQPARSWLNARW